MSRKLFVDKWATLLIYAFSVLQMLRLWFVCTVLIVTVSADHYSSVSLPLNTRGTIQTEGEG